jgi:GAF domain-containing protein
VLLTGPVRRLLARSGSAFHPRSVAAPHPWAQSPLASLRAELAAVTPREQALQHILQYSLRLLHAEIAAMSLYDRRSHRHHRIAVASADRHWSDSRSLACRVPPDFPLAPSRATRDVLVLPDDDPQHPFAAALAHAASAAAYIALSYDDAVIGTLHVVRPAAVPFTPNDRCLARDIGDHATLALATVRVG